VCAFAFGFAFFVAAFVIPQIAGAPEVSGYGLGFTTTQIGLVLAPAGLAALAAGWAGGRLVDRVGPRALVASGSLCGIASYVSLALAHDTAAALAAGSTVLGLAWGLILTGIYPVVIRGVGTDKSGVAPAVVLTMRNTGVSIGTQGAFAFITGAGLAGRFPAEAGFTRAFVMAAVGAAVALLASAFIPGRAPAGR
jgi:predicted MFS family arabinose efflux permease